MAHENYIEGRLLLAGLNVRDLTLRQLMCVTLALRVDGHPMADLDTILGKYDEALAVPLFGAIDPERWGNTPEEWDAMIALVPPAPMRDPNMPRPKPRAEREVAG